MGERWAGRLDRGPVHYDDCAGAVSGLQVRCCDPSAALCPPVAAPPPHLPQTLFAGRGWTRRFTACRPTWGWVPPGTALITPGPPAERCCRLFRACLALLLLPMSVLHSAVRKPFERNHH
jgi:hypothetical protein